MSFCVRDGKDRIVFVTKEDHTKDIKLPEVAKENSYDVDKETQGLRLPNGDINWDCPCSGGLPYGPCGPQYRAFFNCVNEYGSSSQACFEPGDNLFSCMRKYPTQFQSYLKDDDMLETAIEGTDKPNKPEDIPTNPS